jgi:hypothetical protein
MLDAQAETVYDAKENALWAGGIYKGVSGIYIS